MLLDTEIFNSLCGFSQNLFIQRRRTYGSLPLQGEQSSPVQQKRKLLLVTSFPFENLLVRLDIKAACVLDDLAAELKAAFQRQNASKYPNYIVAL